MLDLACRFGTNCDVVWDYGEQGYDRAINPYTVANDHPMAKFRYTRRCFEE